MARLPRRLLNPLKRWAMLLTARRAPDQIIGGDADPYLMRWWVIPRNPLFNIYLHVFHRSDDDRALHDHPWVNASLLLIGGYVEHTIAAGGIHRRRTRFAGDLVVRGPRAAHRIEVEPGKAAITLFITGPRVRAWGFHCPHGWVFWKDFTSDDGRTVGAGCDAPAREGRR